MDGWMDGWIDLCMGEWGEWMNRGTNQVYSYLVPAVVKTHLDRQHAPELLLRMSSPSARNDHTYIVLQSDSVTSVHNTSNI